MMVLVSYDVSTSSAGGAKRLRRIAKVCTDYGQRVQFSVFECIVDPAQWALMRNKLIKIMDEKYTTNQIEFPLLIQYTLTIHIRSEIQYRCSNIYHVIVSDDNCN